MASRPLSKRPPLPATSSFNERVPSRKFHIEPLAIKELRWKLGLSQPKFAALLHVEAGTLRNWEQGRREPTGPARALLAAIRRDPTHVLKALAAA
jgi:putative transcriptional regulator